MEKRCKRIGIMLPLLCMVIMLLYWGYASRVPRHQSLESQHFLTGESVFLPLSPIKVYYSGGDSTYLETEMSLDEMLEQIAANAPSSALVAQYDDQSAILKAGSSYYLLYHVNVRKIPFDSSTTWYFFDMGAEVQRRISFRLVFPFHLTRSDEALCPPDLKPIAAKTSYKEPRLYNVGGNAKPQFLAFYRMLGYYRLEETDDGFRLLGYADGLKEPKAAFPVSFHFTGENLWLE